MKSGHVSQILCVLALAATTVYAGVSSATFTFHKDENGEGTVLGTKNVNPPLPDTAVNCAREPEGVKSVEIHEQTVDLFGLLADDTDYCIIGFSKIDCGGDPTVAITWPIFDEHNKKIEGPYNFKNKTEELLQSAAVVEGACVDLDFMTIGYTTYIY